MSERLFISFSGGETSAFMAIMLLANKAIRDRYSEIRTLFANTGEENEQTLDFVNRCDKTFGLNVEWVEAVVHHGERKASTGTRVDFLTAARNGEPFEEMIRKYGIPNASYKHCTRELKLNPMRAYLADTGWSEGSYDTAIGIRLDEIDRVSSGAKANRLIYPLISLMPTTKPQVNTFWSRQSFRLGLKGYQGNCKWCWKKSLRKHMTLIGETPEIYDFPARMEDKYGLVGPEFGRHEKPEGYRRVFFREGRSVGDLMKMKKEIGPSFRPAEDDSMNFALFDPVMDVGAGCEESCEVFADEDETIPNVRERSDR
jgi:hypothetical protein